MTPLPRGIRLGNLALAFLLELCMLVALGYWGFHTGTGTLARVALGLGAPLLAAVIWGVFMAPRAVFKVPAPLYLALYVVIFGAATLALVVAGQLVLAGIFAALALINRVLAFIWRQ
jgi:hypothetical protein